MIATGAGQYETLLDIKKPAPEAELRGLWKLASAADKKTFLAENMGKIHDRKFLSLVLSKFVVPDGGIDDQEKLHFCLECAKEFGSQFVRNNIAAFEALGKEVSGPWQRELDSILSKAGVPREIPTQQSASRTFAYAEPNMRDQDVKTLFKMLPKDLKDAMETSTGETAQNWFDSIEEVLQDEEKRRTDKLRQAVKRGGFLDLRWGDDSLFTLGKTYLAVAVDRPSGKLLKVFTSKGVQRVPLQWVKHLWPATLIAPVDSWDKLTPKIPEAHPANDQHWKDRFKSGIFVPLHDSLSVHAESQEFLSWKESVKPLLSRLKNLSEDQLLSCAAHLRQNIQKGADKRSDQFKKLIPGTWIECRELGRVAYLGKSDNGKARVWLPEDDVTKGEDFQKAIYKIPYSWIQKTLSEQALRMDGNGYPNHADLLKYSNEFQRHHHGQQRQDLVKGLEDRSLKKLPSVAGLLDWVEFWNEFGSMQSQVIKQRGDQLIQRFQQFSSSDPSLKGTSGKDYLKYQKLHPLKVQFVTDLIQDGQHLGTFLRAEFDLLENAQRTKDQDIQSVFRE